MQDDAASAAMDRYARGEDAAFGELYDLLAPKLLGFLYRQTRDRARAEDLVQQTFLQMHCARETYTTRAQRHDAIAAAHARGAIVRGVWVDVSLEDAQRNVIERMLAAHGRLLEPREMERVKDPTALAPNVLFRTLRDMEPPSDDEGFASLERVRFTRAHSPRSHEARFHVGWRPNATDAWIAEMRALAEKDGAQFVYCTHDGGPPRCWCRPPLPGLLLAFAAAHDIDLARSVVTGSTTVHRKMAAHVGARFEEI